MNNLTLKTEALKDILETSSHSFHDLTFICTNGRFSCNSLLLAVMSKTVRKTLEYSQLEDQMFISLPDFDVKDLAQFFTDLYKHRQEITFNKAVFQLFFDTSSTFIEPNFIINESSDVYNTEDIKNEEYSDDENFSQEPPDNDFSEEEIKDVKLIEDKSLCADTKLKKKTVDNGKPKTKRIRKPRKKEPRKDVKGPHRFDYVHKYCEVCELSFNQASAMWRHVYNHHGPKPELVCEHCQTSFEQHSALEYHMKRYHQEKIPCPECGELQFVTYMNTHMDIYHKICEAKTCDYCGKSYTNMAKFKGHLRTHAGVKKSKYKWLEEFDQNCECNMVFDSQKAKIDHYKLVHLGYKQCEQCRKVVKNPNPDGHTCAPIVRKQRSGPFICKFCDAVFRTNGAVFYHEKTVHSDTPSECNLCEKVFRSYLQLKDHMKKVHVEKTACNICGVLVKDIKDHHETVHMDDVLKKFRCQECGKGFNENQKLNDHKMNVHLKLRPYKCRHGCEMAYNDRSNRNQHEKRKHGSVFS